MRTPLYDAHVRADARIVDFHGWDMPVWYEGIKAEHMATRNACGLFDVCHMGEIYISGQDAPSLLDRLLTIDPAAMDRGRVRYTFLLNKQGGIIDDLTVYCIEPRQEYMLCVNASNSEADFDWITAHNDTAAACEDRSRQTAMLALQGPQAREVLLECTGFDLDQLTFYTFAFHKSAAFGELMISRTGYTGESGVEIFMPVAPAEALWDAGLAAGAVPCGLGARDTLRLEMGYPLHGNDIDQHTSPLEAGLGFAVQLDKPDFIGREPLVQQKQHGLQRRLRGLQLTEKGVPRQGCACLAGEREVGIVTSGSISPVLNQGIALAYLAPDLGPGDMVEIVVRSRRLPARVVKTPFVKSNR